MEPKEQPFGAILQYPRKASVPRKTVMPWYSLLHYEFQERTPNKTAA